MKEGVKLDRANELLLLIQEAELHLEALQKERRGLLIAAHPIKVGDVLKHKRRDGVRAVVENLYISWSDTVVPRGRLLRRDGSLGKNIQILHSFQWEPA